MALSLPRPALTQAGLSWVVVAGTLGITNAFAFADGAAVEAKRHYDNGTPRVCIGHTVFGWFDLADLSLDAHALAMQLHAWESGFHNDPWHKARYNAAVVTGDYDAMQAAGDEAAREADRIAFNAEVERENEEISDDTALMMCGYEAGKAWAQGLEVGSDFRGAMGEGRHRGLSGFELEGFGIGAFEIVNALKIWTQHNTLTIVRLER